MPKDSAGNYVIAAAVGQAGIRRVAAMRYTPAGILDTTFGGGDGIAMLTGLSGSGEWAAGVAVNSDDSVLLYFTQDPTGSPVSRIAKFTSAGVLDVTWGTAGYVDVGTYAVRHSLYVESDGSIVVANNNGTGDGTGSIQRFTSAGVFADIVNFSQAVIGTVQISDDNYGFALRNINTDGIRAGKADLSVPTSSFNGDLPDINEVFEDSGIGTVGMDIDAAGFLYLAGRDSTGADSAIVRVDLTFVQDATWGVGGVAIVTPGAGSNSFTAVQVLSGGEVIASGWWQDGANLVLLTSRLDSAGALVGTYGTAGIETGIVFNNNEVINDSIIDGVAGMFHTGSTVDPGGPQTLVFVARTLQATGALDTTWGTPVP